MARFRQAILIAATLGGATGGAFLFRALHLPLAAILGSLCGATIVSNIFGAMSGERGLRRCGQLFVGASVGAVLAPDVLDQLVRLFPLMLAAAVASNLVALALTIPLAWIARIDRLTALLSALPAGMAEMATLAVDLKADEQAVAIIHTLRVIMVLALIPVWLGLVARAGVPPPSLTGMDGMSEILILVLAAAAIAALATHLKVVNAFVITPMLLSLAVVAAGHRLPPVPPCVLLLAQITIGASLGLRFRLDRLRRMPRVALGGVLSGLVLIGAAFIGIAALVQAESDLDHVSAILAVAPGGLGEMIASAGTLGLLVAAVAVFQLTRSVMTNLFVPPLIAWLVRRKRVRKKRVIC